MGNRERAIEIRKLQAQVREILLDEWDPIGVGDEPDAQDEYDAYVGPITRVLLSGGRDLPIVQKLHLIETDGMGLAGQPQAKLLQVAHSLLRLRNGDC